MTPSAFSLNLSKNQEIYFQKKRKKTYQSFKPIVLPRYFRRRKKLQDNYVTTVESYFKWIKLCNMLLFLSFCCTDMFFTTSALLLKLTLLCIGIFIGIFPETRHFLVAFYRYFRENLDSVIFLPPLAALNMSPEC